jgi:hypothetical protein
MLGASQRLDMDVYPALYIVAIWGTRTHPAQYIGLQAINRSFNSRFLDSLNRVIDYRMMLRGTFDTVEVRPPDPAIRADAVNWRIQDLRTMTERVLEATCGPQSLG